jgi:hypothetical protein
MSRRFQFSLSRLAVAVAWLALAALIVSLLVREFTEWMVIQVPAIIACCAAAWTCLARGIGTSFLVAAGIIVGTLMLFAMGAVFK